MNELYSISWSLSASYLTLLGTTSIIMYFFLKEKSFLFYAGYCVLLVVYLLFYENVFSGFWKNLLHTDETFVFTHNFNRWLQILFYTFYLLFILEYSGLEKKAKHIYIIVSRFIWINAALLTLVYIIYNSLANDEFFEAIFDYWVVPINFLLVLFISYHLFRKKGLQSKFIGIGVIIYLVAILLSLFYTNKRFVVSPNFDYVTIFFIGVLIENLFFSIGISLRIRQLNNDRIKQINENQVIVNKQHFDRMKALIDGGRLEREIIAKDLHDRLGNSIATTLLQFEFVKQKQNAFDENADFNKAMESLENIADEVRDISHNMMPKTLSNLGLVPAVEESFSKLPNIQFEFEYDQEQYDLPQNDSYILFRMIQEIEQNIIKHSNPTIIHISFSRKKNWLTIFVNENGSGFNIEKAKLKSGHGIRNLESAAKMLGGDITIHSIEGKGTSHIIRYPLN